MPLGNRVPNAKVCNEGCIDSYLRPFQPETPKPPPKKTATGGSKERGTCIRLRWQLCGMVWLCCRVLWLQWSRRVLRGLRVRPKLWMAVGVIGVAWMWGELLLILLPELWHMHARLRVGLFRLAWTEGLHLMCDRRGVR